MNERKKVLHFLKTGNYSGAENVAITIITSMREQYGYVSIYVSLSGDIDSVLKTYDIEHAVIKSNGLKEYQRIINQYQPDIIHAHDFGTSTILAKTKSNAHMISHLHNNPLWIKSINPKTLVYIWACRKYKYILGVSESVFEEFIFRRWIAKKSIVVGNPVNCRKIEELAQQASEKEESDILFLGRFSTQKNPLRFLKVLKLCQIEKKDIKVFMVGKGELLDECKEKSIQLGLQNIEMLGFRENPYGYLKNTKVLCVPSIWEGFGLVVVEAFALGIPVVATPVGGMKDIITEGAGKLCSTDEQMKQEIMRLLTDKEYYNQKSRGALRRSKELDNLDKYVNKIYIAYKNEYYERRYDNNSSYTDI